MITRFSTLKEFSRWVISTATSRGDSESLFEAYQLVEKLCLAMTIEKINLSQNEQSMIKQLSNMQMRVRNVVKDLETALSDQEKRKHEEILRSKLRDLGEALNTFDAKVNGWNKFSSLKSEIAVEVGTENPKHFESQYPEDTQKVFPIRTQVFISYSHKDEKWLNRLQVHLKPLERTGIVSSWDDTKIRPGQKWREEIDNAIASTKVAVLLISADFLASDFIETEELPSLLAAAESAGAKILPVIISSSSFETTSLAQFQAVNSPSKPLDSLSRAKQEKTFTHVANEIKNALNFP